MVAQRRPLGDQDLELTPEVQHSLFSALLQERKEERRDGASGSRPPLPQAGAAVLNREGRRPRSGDDLLSSMASRLAQVEQLNKQLTSKLQKKDLEIEELRQQLEHAQGSERGERECSLQAECDRLRHEVQEMKQFLHDTGLHFRSDMPRADGHGAAVDIQVLQSRVEALNANLDVKVQNVDGCGRLVSMEILPLTFFSDGLKLAEHGFMAFQSASAQGVIRDLLNGFTPRLLQEEYPKGVPLKAVDRTKKTFRQWLKEAGDDLELVDGGERLRVVVGEALHAPKDGQTAQQRLLSKLPERVLRKGQVCQVRSAIAERLGEGRSASAPPGSQEVSLLALGRPADAPAARLQVKLEGGQKVFLRMEFNATVGDLWEALADWRSKNKVTRARNGSVLRTAFPPSLTQTETRV